jgi:hypothetical protein
MSALRSISILIVEGNRAVKDDEDFLDILGGRVTMEVRRDPPVAQGRPTCGSYIRRS